MELDIDIYTRDGKLIEIHYIEKRKEFYILLNQNEPRIFKLGPTEIRKGELEENVLQNILEEANKKFESIRLDVLFNPDNQPEPPVLTFFKNRIKPEEVKELTEKIKNKFMGKRCEIIDINYFIEMQKLKMTKIMSTNLYINNKRFWGQSFHVPYRTTHTNRRKVKFLNSKYTEPVAIIVIQFSQVPSERGRNLVFVQDVHFFDENSSTKDRNDVLNKEWSGHVRQQ